MLSRRNFLKGLIGTGFVLTNGNLLFNSTADTSKEDALIQNLRRIGNMALLIGQEK